MHYPFRIAMEGSLLAKIGLAAGAVGCGLWYVRTLHAERTALEDEVAALLKELMQQKRKVQNVEVELKNLELLTAEMNTMNKSLLNTLQEVAADQRKELAAKHESRAVIVEEEEEEQQQDEGGEAKVGSDVRNSRALMSTLNPIQEG